MGEEGSGAGRLSSSEGEKTPLIITSKWVCVTNSGKEIVANAAAFKSTVKIILTVQNLDAGKKVNIIIFDDADKAELDKVEAKVSGNKAETDKIELKEDWAGKTIKIKVEKEPFEKEFIGAKLKVKHGCKCTVYFRPLDPPPPPGSLPPPSGSPPPEYYNGEFGFDFLRDGIPDNTKLEYKSYEETIVAGYNPIPFMSDLSKPKAYSKFKDEYPQIDTNEHLEKAVKYRVPYLNLFPKAFSEASTVEPKPPFYAKLKLWVRIEHDDVDEIRLEINDADKTFLNINNSTDPFVLSKKNRNTNVEYSDEITITCLKKLTENKKITAYAYPRGCLRKPEKEEQKKERIVVGQLLVCKNDEIKKQNFVFVRVKTNIVGFEQAGRFNDNVERANLQKVLYQALICPTILVEERDSSGGIQDIFLDLRDDIRFRTAAAVQTAALSAGATVAAADAAARDKNTGLYIRNGNIDFRNEKKNAVHLLHYIKQKFMGIAENSKYREYFTIFAFEANYSGRVEDFGIKNVLIADGRNKTTIAHEAYHGFGLRHTHREEKPIKDNRQKYIFPDAPGIRSTDNIMSYNVDKRKSTWHWQWVIARKYV